jgi:peptidoglycan hydrolase CwlO-like protein
LVEQLTFNQLVAGSNPAAPTNFIRKHIMTFFTVSVIAFTIGFTILILILYALHNISEEIESQNKLSETQNKLSETQNKLSETQNKLSETQNKLSEKKLAILLVHANLSAKERGINENDFVALVKEITIF